MFLVVTSSKGISSVVMSRILGVRQGTAWKMLHAIRELMLEHQETLPRLAGVVEADEVFVGGKPKHRRHVYNPRGRGTNKPIVFVAVSREGHARAQHVPRANAEVAEELLLRWCDPDSRLMTDSASIYKRVAEEFESHHPVTHSAHEYARPRDQAHVNHAESFAAMIERAMVGVWHQVSRKYLQRYVEEIAWRWNHRRRVERVHIPRGGSRDRGTPVRLVWEPIAPVLQMEELLRRAVGREVRRSVNYGLRWPNRPLASPPPKIAISSP